jgi:tetratricopeptide (TPR) repeat protein
MRKQDHLVQLIHSLTPNEKKYFRKYIAEGDNSKAYGKLFDLLQKSGSYDADDLSRKLKKSKKNLADDKEYLQEILLKSLNNFHAQSMHRTKAYTGLIEADILASKGLPEFAIAHIRKLKKVLIPYDENILYYLALMQEVTLVRTTVPGGLKSDEWVRSSTNDMIKRLESMIINVRLVNMCIEMQGLSADIRYITSKEVQDKALAIVREANELVRDKELPSHSFISYHHLMVIYYFFLGVDTQRSIFHVEQMHQKYMSESEAFRNFHSRTFNNIQTCLMQAYFELREYKKVGTCIQVLNKYLASVIPSEITDRSKSKVFTFTLLLHTASGKHEEALQFIHDQLATFEKYRQGSEQMAVVQLLKAINLFHLQRYDEALSELLPLISSDAPQQLPETRISARALNLMIQYETGNHISMPSYLRAAQRFFTNEELMTKEVTLFLVLMRYLLKQNKKVSIHDFQKKFEEVYDAHRFEIIGYFVIWPWLQSFPKKK